MAEKIKEKQPIGVTNDTPSKSRHRSTFSFSENTNTIKKGTDRSKDQIHIVSIHKTEDKENVGAEYSTTQKPSTPKNGRRADRSQSRLSQGRSRSKVGFLQHFEGMFSQTKNEEKSQQLSPVKPFCRYRDVQQARYRFKSKILRIPNIGKYIDGWQLNKMFESCRRMDLPQARWQLYVLDRIRNKL